MKNLSAIIRCCCCREIAALSFHFFLYLIFSAQSSAAHYVFLVSRVLALCIAVTVIMVLCVSISSKKFFWLMVLLSVDVMSVYVSDYGIVAVYGCSIDMLVLLRGTM
jgi:hypothetical protein